MVLRSPGFRFALGVVLLAAGLVLRAEGGPTKAAVVLIVGGAVMIVLSGVLFLMGRGG